MWHPHSVVAYMETMKAYVWMPFLSLNMKSLNNKNLAMNSMQKLHVCLKYFYKAYHCLFLEQ